MGLDVGPSTLAIVSDRAVALVPLAPEVQQPWAATRRLQRAMDRSRRATNPHCYNADGTFKCGAKITVRSRGYLKLKAQLAETERVLEKRRARSHGRLSNCILGLGNLHEEAFERTLARVGRWIRCRTARSVLRIPGRDRGSGSHPSKPGGHRLAGCAIAARSCGMGQGTTGECRELARGNVGS